MNNLVKVENHKKHGLVVSSRLISKQLGKRHSHVLDTLEKILENRDFGSLIIPTFYRVNNQKRQYKEYLLTKDGFTLYMFNIQGYNDFKMAYINEFNRMEKALKESNINKLPKQQELVLTNKMYYNDVRVITVKDLSNILSLNVSTIRQYIYKNKLNPILLEKYELNSFCSKYNINAKVSLYLLNEKECVSIAKSVGYSFKKMKGYFVEDVKSLETNSNNTVVDVVRDMIEIILKMKNKTIEEITEFELNLLKFLNISNENKKAICNLFHKIKLQITVN